MNHGSEKCQPYLQALCGAATIVFAPSRCWAADQASLPWDYPLDALQTFITGPFAHSVMIVSCIGAALAFALAGDNELVRRLAKVVIGTGVALIAVQLLNYLAP
jgi:type IV secretory pathway VirB2 component (pilin)